jgi:hypothetical protein
MRDDRVFQDWFPLGVAIDLVEGDVREVADAVKTQVGRWTGREGLEELESKHTDWNSLFGSIDVFTNVPTKFFCIPTNSQWTALWTNCFLCDGYDSLCLCLTKNHGLRTIHWKASDEPGIFQPGTNFCHRAISSVGELEERIVHCSQQDTRWEFHENGPALPEEDLSLYNARDKRRRFNEEISIELLGRLGAEPREQRFYDFSRPVRIIERIGFPDTVSREDFAYIRARVDRHKQRTSRHS